MGYTVGEKYPLLEREGAFTNCVSPGDQAVQVGQAIGRGVEEHQREERGRLLTRRQKQCFSGVEKYNLDNEVFKNVEFWQTLCH